MQVRREAHKTINLNHYSHVLDQLLRTRFLCDYLSNEVFRHEVLRILYHGESVHTPQRVIHFGSIATARGRRREEAVQHCPRCLTQVRVVVCAQGEAGGRMAMAMREFWNAIVALALEVK
jgi:hypothetical protein